MSSQVKCFISMLFIVMIVFCIILTRFYFDITKNTENSIRDNKIDCVVKNFGEMQVFKSVNGYYGLMNDEYSVVIEPEWLEILDVTPEMALVSGNMHQDVLIGGVDYEENIVLPFVFSAMEKLGDGYHLGTVQKDNRYIIFDKNYEPVFQKSFDNVIYHNKLFALSSENCIYYYDMSGDNPVLRSAELQCNIGELVLTWKTSNQVYLSELHAEDLRSMNCHVAEYMQMLLTDDFSGLEQISSSEYVNNLSESNRFSGITPEAVSRFSMSRRESGAYDFAFVIAYHTIQDGQVLAGQADMHLYFRKNTENQIILTATDLQVHDAASGAEG